MSSKSYYLHESDGDSFLSNHDDPEDGYTCRPATTKDLTPDRIAEYLDQDAENNNMHEFVGVHQGLLGLLRKQCGIDDDRCGQVMHALLLEGGLQKLEADRR